MQQETAECCHPIGPQALKAAKRVDLVLSLICNVASFGSMSEALMLHIQQLCQECMYLTLEERRF